MRTDTGRISGGSYTHDLLLHDQDDEMVDGIRAFVGQGLASGGQVLVHGTEERVAVMRDALGSHPRLEYGLDRDLYRSPSSTLFAYQRKMAESPEPVELWATGTVPLGDDSSTRAGWSRYESMVNEVLGSYAFHGLCTYDTQTLPEATIEAAKATHPSVSTGWRRAASPEYQHPADFLANPLAGVPDPPDSPPAVSATFRSLRDLWRARSLVRERAHLSEVPHETTEGLVSAANEILANGLEHGATPVELTLWVEPSKLTCRITDGGAGMQDPLSGYRYPEPSGSSGLWVARQMCEDVFVSNLPDGGCSVLLATA